ncbi:MAG: Holliday junction branch migration protein RuvA [Alphaproteobacteria bacterium]|nr:Holliday junction branch migration protein RuvA [Alphaproteobacteria bacterium SS10]
MIASLNGTIAAIFSDTAVIDVGGVGFTVQASSRTLGQLGGVGQPAKLTTHLQMREDAVTLFGFATAEEQQAFEILTKVQGVGGRVALNILSALSTNDLATAIASEDKRAVTRADGVGPKLAQRIVSELKDKIPQLVGSALTPTKGSSAVVTPMPAAAAPVADAAPNAVNDAVSALANLGYDRSDAHRAALKAQQSLGEGAKIDDLIRASLKELAPA